MGAGLSFPPRHRATYNRDLTAVAIGNQVQVYNVHERSDFCATVLCESKAHDMIVTDVAFSPYGTKFATCGLDGAVKIFCATSGRALAQFKNLGKGGCFLALSWSANDAEKDLLLAGARDPVMGNTLRLFATPPAPTAATSAAAPPPGTQVGDPILGHHDVISTVVWSPDGKMWATADLSGTIILWNAHTRKRKVFEPLQNGHDGQVTSLSFSPDSTYLASAGGEDKLVILWETFKGERICVFKGHHATVNAVSFSPDGNHIVSSSLDETCRFWDLKTQKSVASYEAGFANHKRAITAVAFSPFATLIATGSADGAVRFFDPTTQQQIGADCAPVNCRNSKDPNKADVVKKITFSPDGTMVVIACGKNVKLLDFVRGVNISKAQGLCDGKESAFQEISALQFSDEGMVDEIMLTVKDKKPAPTVFKFAGGKLRK